MLKLSCNASKTLIPADYRPICITRVLTRLNERIVIRRQNYPALLSPPPALHFADQFTFHPTGSTIAAIISLLHTIINSCLLNLSLDFSNAMDTVRHSTLLQKFSQFNLPDHIYNWLTDFFTNFYSHSLHGIQGPAVIVI